MSLTSDLLGHWNVLEILWTLIALVGVGFSALNIREALRNYRALGGKVNGRRRISLGDIRRELVRLLIYAACILAGITAGGQASQSGTHTAAGWAITIALLIIEALQVSQSILDRLDTNYLLTHGLQSRDSSGRFVKDDQG